MKWIFVPAFGLAAALSLGAAGALADSIFEVENQRANARAGGPTDTELLRRWGTPTGTPHYRGSRQAGSSKRARQTNHYRGRRR